MHDPLDGVAVEAVPERGLEGGVEVRAGACPACPRARACGRSRTSARTSPCRLEVRVVVAAGAQRQRRSRPRQAPRGRGPDRVTGEAHGAGTLPAGADGARRAPWPRDHALRHALPGVPPRRASEASAARASSRSRRVQRQPGHELGCDLLDRLRARRSNDSSGRRSLGQRRRQRRVTSAMPEWPADSGRAPQAAASAATIPKDSGNVLGITCASQAGSRSGRSSCSSRPVKWIRSAAAGAAREPVLADARRGTRSGSCSSPGGPPSSSRPRAAMSRERLEVARAPAPPRSAPARRGRCRSRRSRGAPPARGSTTSGQAASSRSTPFDTISLPT